MDKNTNHPATLLEIRDALRDGTPVFLNTSAGSVEAHRVRNGQGLTVTFHPPSPSGVISAGRSLKISLSFVSSTDLIVQAQSAIIGAL